MLRNGHFLHLKKQLSVIKMLFVNVFSMTVLSMVMSLSPTHFSWNDKMRVLTYNYNYQSRSALDCGANCSLNPDCWSASYNDGTGNCLLSDVNVFQDNWVTDAVWLTLAKTAPTIGTSCIVDSDCREANSRCVDNNFDGRRKCLCDHHTEFDETFRMCKTKCTMYSDTFTRIEHTYIHKYNIADYHDTKMTLGECKQRCIDEGQNCASFDYSSNSGRCALNYVTYKQIRDGDQSQLGSTEDCDVYTRECSLN